VSGAEAALARMLAASRASPATLLLRGTVLTWDAVNGYVVTANGAELPVTTILASVAGTLAPGDVVALLRHKSTILVLGQVVAPS
jgi:hypothetical protein